MLTVFNSRCKACVGILITALSHGLWDLRCASPAPFASFPGSLLCPTPCGIPTFASGPSGKRSLSSLLLPLLFVRGPAQSYTSHLHRGPLWPPMPNKALQARGPRPCPLPSRHSPAGSSHFTLVTTPVLASRLFSTPGACDTRPAPALLFTEALVPNAGAAQSRCSGSANPSLPSKGSRRTLTDENPGAG